MAAGGVLEKPIRQETAASWQNLLTRLAHPAGSAGAGRRAVSAEREIK